jgi:hypothetical protein
MFEQLAQRISRTGQPRSPRYHLALLGAGFVGVVVLLPLLPWAAGRAAAGAVPWRVPRSLEIVAGCLVGPAGLVVALWAVAELWRTGHGTPFPFAAWPLLPVSSSNP